MGFDVWGVEGEGKLPEGCRHKAVVQGRGQRAGREQAPRGLRVTNITG
jgi:hypothetical protein